MTADTPAGGTARLLLDWLPVAAWAAAVWFVGGLPDTSAAPSIPHLDKLAHFGMYGVLGYLVGRAARRARPAAGLVVLALAVMLGAADERRQGFLPGRSMDVMDWVADTAGCIVGFTIARRRSAARKTTTTNGSD